MNNAIHIIIAGLRLHRFALTNHLRRSAPATAIGADAAHESTADDSGKLDQRLCRYAVMPVARKVWQQLE